MVEICVQILRRAYWHSLYWLKRTIIWPIFYRGINRPWWDRAEDYKTK